MNHMKLLYSLSVLFLPLMFIACEGDAGLPGEDLMGKDHVAPVVDIILPIAHRLIYNEAALEVHVQDDGEVDRVEFLIDGEVFENQDLTLLSQPYQTMWDCRTLSLGQHFIQAIAYDKFGRIGYSPRVSFYKISPDSVPPNETITYYDEPEFERIDDGIGFLKDDAMLWRIPDESGQYTGFGTRFTLDRPAKLIKVGINFQFSRMVGGADIWFETKGTPLKIEIHSSENGLPAELLSESVLDFKVFGGTNYVVPLSGWVELPIPLGARISRSLNVPAEFIITVTLSETATGDTIAIATDLGSRRNWHGMVRENGEWRTFDAGPRVAFNPLIWAKIRYPALDN